MMFKDEVMLEMPRQMEKNIGDDELNKNAGCGKRRMARSNEEEMFGRWDSNGARIAKA